MTDPLRNEAIRLLDRYGEPAVALPPFLQALHEGLALDYLNCIAAMVCGDVGDDQSTGDTHIPPVFSDTSINGGHEEADTQGSRAAEAGADAGHTAFDTHSPCARPAPVTQPTTKSKPTANASHTVVKGHGGGVLSGIRPDVIAGAERALARHASKGRLH
jgi:hypothetical protein